MLSKRSPVCNICNTARNSCPHIWTPEEEGRLELELLPPASTECTLAWDPQEEAREGITLASHA
eukprot:5780035-Alexandrium_andersonii.AAC.1